MTLNRRRFGLAATASLLALRHGETLLAAPALPKRNERPLRLLVLGGTQFIGIHLVREAQRRGHLVTLFNRGRTNPELFADLEKLRGDRDGQLDALRDREWDCVIDDSGLLPRQLQLSTALLAARVRRYLFMSSVDVYRSFAQPNNENSPLQGLRPNGPNAADAATPTGTPGAAEPGYGEAKAICESLVRAAFPDGHLVLRPAMIVGPLDPAERMAWWLASSATDGAFPAPGSRHDPIQFIDARDLARFALDLLERGEHGAFNVASAPRQFSIGQLVRACVARARHNSPALHPYPVWIPRKFLESQGASASFPLWPGRRDEWALPLIDTRRARAAGLKITPLKLTANETMDWLATRPDWRQQSLRTGLGTEPQQLLLRAWEAQQRQSRR